MANATYVLGTNLSHDGSVCLLKDGEIVVAIEKERITRKKHDGMNDTECIVYCLGEARIRLEDVAVVVQNTWQGMFERGNSFFFGPRIVQDAVKIITISHHLAHAFSAFGTSQFDDAAVLVLDNGGNSFDEVLDKPEILLSSAPPKDLAGIYAEVDSYYKFSSSGWTCKAKSFSPPGFFRKPYPMIPTPLMHSIGGVYLAVSAYVFNDIGAEGKLMGLAPYGRPAQYDFQMFDVQNGELRVLYDWMSRFDRPCYTQQQFKKDFQYYADLAYWTQKEFERAVLAIVRHRYELSPSKNLCYAGGLALNAVANRRIIHEGPFENVYIQPAAGDNGIAIGCAYYGWLQVLGRERKRHNGRSSFGIRYSPHEFKIQAADARHPAAEVQQSTDVARIAARLLADRKVVGWFQGGSEFGPRALGNRSILAHPGRAATKDFINLRIKNREDFRPFAPVVLLEDKDVYFDCAYDSPYMILVAPVKEAFRSGLAAVTHVDGSARIQTVTEDFNPTYYSLLKEFRSLTGLGVLLNTSFNKRQQPIVETPEQALEFFWTSELDALVLEDYIILKRPDGIARAVQKKSSALPIFRFLNTKTGLYTLDLSSGRLIRPSDSTIRGTKGAPHAPNLGDAIWSASVGSGRWFTARKADPFGE